ncbi:Choline dehydrogenase [Trichoderma ghanense]|uniref:Choline dehydrogenase n=1 Tax=Trichoderma ghanense TaxID=65468 RepID=A0ABY2GQH7_9HYPO
MPEQGMSSAGKMEDERRRGAGGCVLASRLAEDTNVSVLLLEKGFVNDGLIGRIPLLSMHPRMPGTAAVTHLGQLSTAVNRKLALFWGEALGGSTRINAMVLTRCPPSNYNDWSQEFGLKDWAWEKVEPYFVKSENAIGHAKAQYRGLQARYRPRILEGVASDPKTSSTSSAFPSSRSRPRGGNNLMDHIAVAIMSKHPAQDTIHSLYRPLVFIWHFILWIFFGRGLLAYSSLSCAIFARTTAIDDTTLRLGQGFDHWPTISDKTIDDYACRTYQGSLHYACTCRMALDPADGVVDPKLRVFGVDRLRIGDASVFPKISSGHTMAPTMMVAERCADFIKETWRDKESLGF